MRCYVLTLLIFLTTLELGVEPAKAGSQDGFSKYNNWMHPVWTKRLWLPDSITLKIIPGIAYDKTKEKGVLSSFEILTPIKSCILKAKEGSGLLVELTVELHRLFYPEKAGDFEDAQRLSLRTKRDGGVNQAIAGMNDQRESIFGFLEKTLKGFGHNGRNCVLRIICEIQSDSLRDYGMVGDMAKVVFSPSRSSLAQTRLLDYLDAETRGVRKECGKFVKKCPFSIFKWQKTF